jgi:hypothetical protein
MTHSAHRALMALLVLGACFGRPLQAQIPMRDIQTWEGPWECEHSGRINGVFITAMTSLKENHGQSEITAQSVDIRVYERQHGQERWGDFAPGAGGNGSTILGNAQLKIQFKGKTDIDPFSLTVRFDPAADRWVGAWSLCDPSQQIVLQRPHAAQGMPSSPFVGDWEGRSVMGERPPHAPGTLHIAQSSDGALTAWLDRSIAGFNPRTQTTQTDQRNGEWLNVVSASENTIVLQTTNPMGALHRYEGTLSSDGKSLAGAWPSVAGSGGSLNAPAVFQRVRRETRESHP